MLVEIRWQHPSHPIWLLFDDTGVLSDFTFCMHELRQQFGHECLEGKEENPKRVEGESERGNAPFRERRLAMEKETIRATFTSKGRNSCALRLQIEQQGGKSCRSHTEIHWRHGCIIRIFSFLLLPHLVQATRRMQVNGKTFTSTLFNSGFIS